MYVLTELIIHLSLCRHRILSALNLHARPRKFQKYYLLSIGPRKHIDWCGKSHSGIRPFKVPFPVELTKIPLVNLKLTKSQIVPKFSQNNIFHAFTSNLSHLEIFVNFDQVWLSLTLSLTLRSLSNDYSWVEIGVKTVEISRKPCKAHQHSSRGDNFWSNRLIVNFFCALETRHLGISRDTKISLIQFLEKCNQSQHRKASQLGWVGASCRVTNPTQCTYKVCQASGHVPRSPEPSFCIKK